MTSASLRTRPGGFSTSSGAVPTWERVQHVWNYRRILGLLVRRDLKVRYAGSFLGYLWTVLDPLLMSLVFWFIFTQIFHRHVGYPPYILFLVMGQMIMSWFQSGVTGTAKALRAEAQMVRSSSVPRELWVVRIAMSKGVEYVYSLPGRRDVRARLSQGAQLGHRVPAAGDAALLLHGAQHRADPRAA